MRRLALTLVPLLLLACDRAPVAPDVAPSFDIDNAPDFTGIVVRGADPAGQTWGDPAKGLRVTIGFDPVDRCANPDSYTDYDIVIWADKWLSSGRDVSLNKFKDARIAVWPFFAFDCALFSTVAPLAAGYGDVNWVDNDFFGSANPNSNAWGWSAHATLAWTADGSPAQLSAHAKLLWDKENDPRIVTRTIILK